MVLTRALPVLCLAAWTSAAHIKVGDVDSTTEQEASTAVQLPEPKNFMTVVRDMRERWKAHKMNQMRTLEPWKVKAYEEQKIRHRAERQEVQRREHPEMSEPAESPAQAEERKTQQADEKQVKEDKRREKFGEQYLLTIQDPAGNEFPVRFRSKTHFRVLMEAVTQRLALTPEEAAKVNFMFNGAQLMSGDTADGVGMKDQDVINLEGETMVERMRQQEAAAKRSRMKAKLAAKADNARLHEQMLKARQNIEKERRVQGLKQQAATQEHFKEQHMIHLKFNDERGGEVRLGFKRENWLGGLMKVACKRLGHNPQATHFKVNGTNIIIRPTDSAHALGLHEDAVITVKVNRRFSAPAPGEEPVV